MRILGVIFSSKNGLALVHYMPHNHFERLARQFAVNAIHQKQLKQYKMMLL
jgi:hypothetical protein